MLNFDQVDLADKGSECKPFFIKPDNILIAVDNPFYGLLKFSRKHGRIGNNQTVCRIEYLNNVIRESIFNYWSSEISKLPWGNLD